MTAHLPVYRRVLRRETHASRTGPASIIASVLILLVLGALVWGVWSLVDPGFGESSVVAASGLAARIDVAATVIVAGVVLVLIAMLLIGAAVLPGHLSRRARVADRMGILVDDGVLADAAADLVAARCGVERSHVFVTAGRHYMVVRVTPTSGLPVDKREVQDAAAEALSAAGFDLVVKATVARQGVVS